MASIKRYKKAKGYGWRVQYRAPDGTSRTKQGFRTKDEAQAWADKNATTIRDGQWISPTVESAAVSSLWPGWEASQHHLAASSMKALDASWRVHVKPRWGHIPVSKVHPADVQEWVDGLADKRSPTIVHRAYGVLRSLMGDAVRYRMVSANPCDGVRLPPRKGKKMYVLSEAQLRSLVDASRRYQSLLLFLGWTGARWGEAAALTVGDLDLKKGRATISKSASTVGGAVTVGSTKTGRTRVIGIPRHVCSAMREDVRGKLPGALVWANTKGGYLTTPSRRSWFHSAVDRCRAADPDFPDISPHDLRHTAASMLVASGAPVTLVARQLGHQSVKLTLDTYAHLFDDQLSDVVEMSWNSAK
ncbi:tyrosine-type recombinase/integrase [Corynebacterium sp. H113]|uniref:tyrosine-type recombinase/integrase n=1 Tax=Corynebacterium sp. H113 TaxID=3133419 RepID=UPI0030B3417F